MKVLPIIDLKKDYQEFYFCSDVHFGSPNSDVAHFKRELKEARERNARIIIIGDLFDAIYPLGDPRYNPSNLIKELQGKDDAPLQAAYMMRDILEPYQDLIDMIGLGNHEVTLLKHTGNHLIKILLMMLNSERKHKIMYGGYTGYLGYRFITNKTAKRILKILYHHGAGGGAPVTKGLIDVNRKQTNWAYDIFVFGHKHHSWGIRDTFISPVWGKDGEEGYLLATSTRAVQTGNFFKSYINHNDGIPSYEEVHSHAPKPIGGVFVKVALKRKRVWDNTIKKNTNNVYFDIRVEV